MNTTQMHLNAPPNLPSKPKIILVEDEVIVAMDLAQQLSEAGYEVCGIADNQHHALELARKHLPDLILMDVIIKGDGDGVDTAARILKELQLPVVFLTAFSDDSTVQRAAMTAPYGYVTKPFQMKELLAAVSVALYKGVLERQLKASERWFASTLHCVADGVVAMNTDGTIRFLNPAAERTLGVTLNEVIGKPAKDVLVFESGHFDASPTHADAQPKIDFGRVMLTRDGRRVSVDESVASIRDGQGTTLGVVCALRDVSSRVEAEAALRLSEERFRTAFDFAPVGMALVAMNGRFLQGNNALHTLLKCSESELVMLNQADVSPTEDHEYETAKLHDVLASHTPFVQFEKRYRARDGHLFWALVSVSLLRRQDTAMCYLYQIHDMSARKAAEMQLLHTAYHDVLTGLPNRVRVEQEMQSWLANAARHSGGFAVVFIDLDGFKIVNDTYGHLAGDKVLSTVAKRITSVLREVDFVARWGGDEFIALLNGAGTPAELNTVLQKLIEQTAQPIEWEKQTLRVGLSSGIAMYPGDGVDAQSLIRHADEALYKAKKNGAGQVCFYNAMHQSELTQIEAISTQLQRALDQSQVTLRWHVLHPMQNGAAMLIEASAHWPENNPPDDNTNAWQTYSQATQVTMNHQRLALWLFHRTCHDLAKQGGTGTAILRLGVKHLRSPVFVQHLKASLQKSKLPPQRMCLEIEASRLEDPVMYLENSLDDIRSLGIGLGISNVNERTPLLPMLLRWRPAWIKPSEQLMHSVDEQQPDAAALLTALVASAQSMDVATIAWGIESELAHQTCLRAGCTWGQGSYWPDVALETQNINWLHHSAA